MSNIEDFFYFFINGLGSLWFSLSIVLFFVYKYQKQMNINLVNFIRSKGYIFDLDLIKEKKLKESEVDEEVKNTLDYIEEHSKRLGLKFVIDGEFYYLFKGKEIIASSYTFDVMLFKLNEFLGRTEKSLS